MSKKSDAVEYFKANPGASPAEVALMFGVAKGNIYLYRKEALGNNPKKVRTKKSARKKVAVEVQVVGIEEAPNTDKQYLKRLITDVSHTDEPRNWRTYSQFMTREEFTGFLRGGILDNVANYDGSVCGLQLARGYLDKLIEMQSRN